MTDLITISWEEFLNEAKKFIEVSKRLGDQWEIKNDNNESNTYISKTMKISVNLYDDNLNGKDELTQNEICEDEMTYNTTTVNNEVLISIEYHVVYSISYQVPVLYFRGHKSDGKPITLEDSWKIFSNHGIEETAKDKNKENMLSILTQTDHPILFIPFLSLHPCRTAQILAQTKNSKNRIATFLSVFGPFIKLNLSNDYANEFN